MINIIDNSNKKNFSVMTTEELVEFLNTKDLTIEVEGDNLYRSLKVGGEGKDDAEVFEAMSWLIKKCGNNYFEFMKKLRGGKEEEKKSLVSAPTPIPARYHASSCIHAYHSTHTFKFGGGFEVPYNINRGEAYNDDGTILAYIDPSGYKNKSHIVPPLRSMTKAALKAKLITDGNHDAALHL